MNKKLVLGVAVAGVAASTLIASGAYAYQGKGFWKTNNYNPEKREAVQEAIENNDYSAWQELMADRGKVTEVINEDNFSQFSEMHNLMQDGKYEEAQKIREELDLPSKKNRAGKMNYFRNNGNFLAAREAIDNNDYSVWKEAVGNAHVGKVINEENFPRLVEAHNLMQDGKYEEAREIRQELGLGQGRFGGRGLN